MMRVLPIRGMLVGVLAGLLSFGVARVLASRRSTAPSPMRSRWLLVMSPAPARPAITSGTTTATVRDHGTAEEPVSRDTQRGIGLPSTATVVYGAALGGSFRHCI